jgi:hypothetical protein
MSVKLEDGTVVHVGDRMRLSNGDVGTVVASMEIGEYSAEYAKENWEYLRVGILIRTDKGALVHLSDAIESGFLVRAE